MARRRNWGSLARTTGGDMVRTDVRINEAAVRELHSALGEGLFEAAKKGKERMLDHSRGMFKTTRSFERTAFAIGFDNGREIGKDGPRKDMGAGSLRGAAHYPVDPGLVSYFGYAWFVARFFETGTVKHHPRPSLSRSLAEMPGEVQENLRTYVKRRGSRR